MAGYGGIHVWRDMVGYVVVGYTIVHTRYRARMQSDTLNTAVLKELRPDQESYTRLCTVVSSQQ